MNDQPPPIIAQAEPPKTIYHQAAAYCLLAPFVAFAVQFVIVAMGDNQPPKSRAEALLPAIVFGFIFLSGVVAGVISLFGIKRYGKRGILWKSVTGISIVVLLLLAAIPNIVRAKQIAKQRHEHPQP